MKENETSATELSILRTKLDAQQKEFEARNRMADDKQDELRQQVARLERSKDSAESLWREMEGTFNESIKQLREEKHKSEMNLNKKIDALKSEVCLHPPN